MFHFADFAVAHKTSLVTKAFFHQGKLSDKVMFYFDVEPVCNELPKSSSHKNTAGKKQVVLFFPLTSITREAQKSLAQLPQSIHTGYTVEIKEVKKPVSGLKIVAAYDPELIIFDYATCDVISATKGFVMSFHNKKMLDKIKQASNPVLRYACSEQPDTKKVVIDFGHGGSDDGTIGCHALKEKDVTLQVGKKVVSLLKKKGFDVCVTRDRDVFVPLDARTKYANEKKAELFISIHANSSPKKAVTGVETYWLPRLSIHKSYNQQICDSRGSIEAFYGPFDGRTELLARCVHEAVIASVQKTYPIADRAVKKSVSQVLVGTDMPSTLIEIGFLSDPQEAAWLSKDNNQWRIASGICDGIEAYRKKVLAA
jgi:N-acetylmuramoyl-L-alanine amidase